MAKPRGRVISYKELQEHRRRLKAEGKLPKRSGKKKGKGRVVSIKTARIKAGLAKKGLTGARGQAEETYLKACRWSKQGHRRRAFEMLSRLLKEREVLARPEWYSDFFDAAFRMKKRSVEDYRLMTDFLELALKKFPQDNYLRKQKPRLFYQVGMEVWAKGNVAESRNMFKEAVKESVAYLEQVGIDPDLIFTLSISAMGLMLLSRKKKEMEEIMSNSVKWIERGKSALQHNREALGMLRRIEQELQAAHLTAKNKFEK
jgi:hypothetical protein